MRPRVTPDGAEARVLLKSRLYLLARYVQDPFLGLG